MFSTLFTIALFATVAIGQGSPALSINTPSLTQVGNSVPYHDRADLHTGIPPQCQDAQISWDTTERPYNLIVVLATDPCGNPV